MTRYRIVRDNYAGYEVQSWRWWFPFWVQGTTNTHRTVERAKQYIEYKKNGGVVEYVD